jgi:hypothetical protein
MSDELTTLIPIKPPTLFLRHPLEMAKTSQPSLMKPLLDIISTAVFTMQDELASAKLPEPWLAAPEFHPWDDEMPPIRYFSARKDLIAALGMILVSASTGLRTA